MGIFDFANDSVQQVEQNDDDEHKSSWTHELVAGAAGFYAMKKFEESQRAKGETVDHGTAKEMLAALAAGEADKLVETKGLDAIDREKAKRQAADNARTMYDEQYGGQDQYDPNSTDMPDFSASQY